MTEEEFIRVSTFFKGRYGIDLSQKQGIIQGRMKNYMRSAGWRSFTEYMDELEKDVTGRLEKKLVDILTTNHTYFMREFEHFDFLRQQALPELKKKELVNKDLCIWCGASSTGEEPYMIAMMLMDFFGLDHSSWDTKVLATDVCTEVLHHAIQGIYDKDQIESLPEHWKRRFMQPIGEGDQVSVTEELKKQVLFRRFNLMDPFPFKRKMHIVFLRNVMIYFDQATKQELIQKIYDIMEPGGYFFIGRTETIDRDDTPFQMIQPSIFQK